MKKLYFLFIAFFLFAQSSNAQNALNFDGLDDYALQAGASAALVGASGFSLSMWMNPTYAVPGYPDFGGAAGLRNDANADFYLLQLSSTSLEARLRPSSGTAYTMAYNGLVLNTWQHYVMVYDGTKLILYKDGTEVQNTVANGTITNAAVGLHIGMVPFSNPNFYFEGDLDEVSLWNIALGPNEVQAIYDCGVIGTETGLVSHYKMDQGVAGGDNTSETMLSANFGPDATLNNMALTGTTGNFVTGDATANQPTIDPTLNVSGSMLTAVQIADSYQWYNCDAGYVVIPGDTTAVYNAPGTGNYAVFMVDGICSGYSYCENISITNIEAAAGLEMNIYPNPTAGSLVIELGEIQKDVSVSVINIEGKVVYTETNRQTDRLNLELNVAPGIYQLRIESEAGVSVIKLVKK